MAGSSEFHAPPLQARGIAAAEARQERRMWLVTISASAAVFVFALGAQWLIYIHLFRETNIRFISPAIAAIATGLALFKAEQRRKSDLRRLRLIVETNHHIRNALQVVVGQNHAADPRSAEMLRDAVHRIEWVLTDVLPGIADHHCPRGPRRN